MNRRWLVHTLLATLLLLLCAATAACSSIEVVRLKPGLLKTPPKTEPLAGIQVSCVGFYVFTLGIPTCDLEKVVNEILIAKAREIGASKLLSLRFRQTPESGVWWLTKLLWFRTARASAIAVVAQPAAAKAAGELDLATAGEAPARRDRATAPASAPASAPTKTPASATKTPVSAPASTPTGAPPSKKAGSQ